MKMRRGFADYLASYLQTINKIPYINHGGCGFVALNIYNLFVKLGFKPKIIAIDYNQETVQTLKNLRKNNAIHDPKTMESVSNHYMILIDNYLFDSSGYYFERKPSFFYGNHKEEISKADLIFALKYGTWNSMFDRSHVKGISSHFRKYTRPHIKQAPNIC